MVTVEDAPHISRVSITPIVVKNLCVVAVCVLAHADTHTNTHAHTHTQKPPNMHMRTYTRYPPVLLRKQCNDNIHIGLWMVRYVNQCILCLKHECTTLCSCMVLHGNGHHLSETSSKSGSDVVDTMSLWIRTSAKWLKCKRWKINVGAIKEKIDGHGRIVSESLWKMYTGRVYRANVQREKENDDRPNTTITYSFTHALPPDLTRRSQREKE